MAQVAKSNEAEKATDNLAAISSRTGNGAAAVAGRTGDDVAAFGRRVAAEGAAAAREATERTGDAARHGLEQVQRTAGAALEAERAVARRSTEGATEVAQAFAELVREQARDNVAAFRSLTETFWDRTIQVQAELVRASFARSAAFTRRYLEVARAVTASAVSATKEQARQAG